MVSITLRQLKVLVHGTNSFGRFVAAQVVNCDFAAHKLARASNFNALGHGLMCSYFLLHSTSFCINDDVGSPWKAQRSLSSELPVDYSTPPPIGQ
jgi:hypothetical protein